MKTEILKHIQQVGSKEFPVKSKLLEFHFRLSGAVIRDIIRELRREGISIVPTSRGYYYDNSPEAILKIAEDLECRALSMLNTVKILKNNYAKQEALF